MTSYDGSVPATGSSGRRRALGRGPGTEARPDLPATESESPAAGQGHDDPAAGAEPDPQAASERPEAAVFPGGESVADVPADGNAEPGSVPGGASTAVSAVPEPLEEPEPRDGVFKVRLANFEGPFDLLLQLISKHKLDVTEVALSKVTDEFMAHIRAMGPNWDLDQTTEFLVVAATLLDLKAARLLPTATVEDEADLALLEARDLLFARLLQYRAYKQIAEIFNRRTEEEARRHPRTVGLEPHHADLLPEVVISIG
ncbi:MAG: segregation/condensation protein A, partial [Streptomyces sp.]|nr:segregation/condensation protein A [Streptomyces sp.]